MLEIGRAYVDFGLREPTLFRMMFAPTARRASNEVVAASGKACFQYVLDEVVGYCRANRVDGDADLVALQLWTFVHGVTSLLSDRAYAAIAPELVVRWRILATHTHEWFGVPPTGRALTLEGMAIYRIESDRLMERWVVLDGVGSAERLRTAP